MSDFKPLPTNLYTIRLVNYHHPGHTPNGMYVTGGSDGYSLTVSGQWPPESQRQNWHVFHNTKTNQYTIKFVELDGSERHGFTWGGSGVRPGFPVYLSKPQEFTISPTESSENDCIIRPVAHSTGADICVGVNDYTRQLELRFFSIKEQTETETRPVWRFTRLPVD